MTNLTREITRVYAAVHDLHGDLLPFSWLLDDRFHRESAHRNNTILPDARLSQRIRDKSKTVTIRPIRRCLIRG